MFHNRIASDLRSHFSTVGPSPLPSSASAATLSASTFADQTGLTPRLTLVPASASPPHAPFSQGTSTSATASPAALYDLVSITAHRSAAFFAEAAVLVLVLGILDRFLASNRIEIRWIGGAFLISLTLLAASIVTDLTARRWLRHH